MRGRAWTEAASQQLRQLATTERSIKAIAIKLGRDFDTTRERMIRLSLHGAFMRRKKVQR